MQGRIGFDSEFHKTSFQEVVPATTNTGIRLGPSVRPACIRAITATLLPRYPRVVVCKVWQKPFTIPFATFLCAILPLCLQYIQLVGVPEMFLQRSVSS